MNIFLVGPTYPFRGGISHYTTLLFRHLRKRHDVTFLSFSRQYPRILYPGKSDIDPSKKHIQEEDACRILDSMNPLTWVKTAWRIVKNKPDLVIFPWWVSFWAPQFFTISILVKLFSSAKVLFLCHNVVEHESGLFDKLLTKVTLKKGDLFLVHSLEDKTNLLSMIPSAKVRTSYHPTYDIFNQKEWSPGSLKKKFGIGDRPIVLFFGFVREYKGLKYLLRALPAVLNKVEVSLFVVGEFWKDKEEYINLIKGLKLEKDVVVVDEYVPNEEIGLYFSAADLVVQPYVSATGSGIVQIAYGFGKPVIVTSVGSLPEVVEEGKTGYIVPPCSPEDLAKAIIKFFSENKKNSFKENIRLNNYEFSWDRLIDSIEHMMTQ